MNVNEIISRVRRLTYTNSAQYPDAVAIQDLNVVYKDITNTITQEVGEDFFYTYLKTDSVIGQEEYTLDDPEHGLYVNKLKDVFILNSAGVYERYKGLSKRDFDNTVSRDPSAKCYYLADRSIFINPVATKEINDWLKIDVILKPKELTLDSVDTDIAIDPEFHNIIALGMIQYVYQSRGKIQEAISSNQTYQMFKNDMVAQLSDRINNPEVGLLPNLDYYE